MSSDKSYQTIVNPLTGRKVDVNGKIGKRLLKHYKNHYEKHYGGMIHPSMLTYSLKEGTNYNKYIGNKNLALSQCNNKTPANGIFLNNRRQPEIRFCYACFTNDSNLKLANYCLMTGMALGFKKERAFLCSRHCGRCYEHTNEMDISMVREARQSPLLIKNANPTLLNLVRLNPELDNIRIKIDRDSFNPSNLENIWSTCLSKIHQGLVKQLQGQKPGEYKYLDYNNNNNPPTSITTLIYQGWQEGWKSKTSPTT